jgi:hypothetical protein
VVRQHFAIARQGHGIAGIHLERARSADGIVHQFRQLVAELAEALAVGRGGRESRLLLEGAARLDAIERMVHFGIFFGGERWSNSVATCRWDPRVWRYGVTLDALCSSL